MVGMKSDVIISVTVPGRKQGRRAKKRRKED
jgi:hypothetical protein